MGIRSDPDPGSRVPGPDRPRSKLALWARADLGTRANFDPGLSGPWTWGAGQGDPDLGNQIWGPGAADLDQWTRTRRLRPGFAEFENF